MSSEVTLREWEGASVEHWRRSWAIPELRIYQRTSSTNDLIRTAARTGAAAGTTAIAEYQAAGRGRLGRAWEAPPGRALLLSVLLRPAPGGRPDAAGALPLRVGLALAAVVARHTSAAPALKWPNDLLIGGRKVAGILCEAGADFVVVGLGLNVLQEVTDFPRELQDHATSLRLAGGTALDRGALAQAILAELRPLFAAPHRPLEPAELASFDALDALAGRPLFIDDAPAGIGAGIDPLGALLVEQPGGRKSYYAGTVRSTP